MNIKTPKDVGHYIASTRKALKWSQTDLAVKIGKDQRFVSRLENDPSSVSFGTVLMVLNVLNINTTMTNQHSLQNNKPAFEPVRSSKTTYFSNSRDSQVKKSMRGGWKNKPMRMPVVVGKKKTESK